MSASMIIKQYDTSRSAVVLNIKKVQFICVPKSAME